MTFEVDACGEKVAGFVVSEVDAFPFGEGSFDTGSKAAVGKQTLCYVGDEDGVADVRVAGADLFDGEMVGQVSGAGYLYAVVEDEEADGRADEIVAMHEGIDEELFEDDGRDLWGPGRVDAWTGLDFGKVS